MDFPVLAAVQLALLSVALLVLLPLLPVLPVALPVPLPLLPVLPVALLVSLQVLLLALLDVFRLLSPEDAAFSHLELFFYSFRHHLHSAHDIHG